MIYFATPSTERVRDAMRAGLLGCICTPAEGKRPPEGVPWASDNGCFGQGYPGDGGWATWLQKMRCHGQRQFAVVPDVVGDAQATMDRFADLAWVPKRYGYPVAFAAQDGLERLEPPWRGFDVLFIGGSTEWKLGEAARELVAEAKRRRKWVHYGRVNSQIRLERAAAWGCDSADGTYLTRGPDENLPKLLGWLRHVNGQATLWDAVSA